MSIKPESQFINSVHARLPPSDKLYRMKNNNPYSSGIADCWYSGKRDLWVEYKFIVLPKRAGTIIKPGLSELQMDWCTSRRNEGRNVLVVVGCKEGGVVLRDPANWRGLPREFFVSQLISRAEIAATLVKETS